MKTKCVRVLDEGTDMRFIVMEPDTDEEHEVMSLNGWNIDTTKIIIYPASKPGIVMGRFNCPSYDIDEYGTGIRNNHTTQCFLETIRGKHIEEIPETIDITPKVTNPALKGDGSGHDGGD